MTRPRLHHARFDGRQMARLVVAFFAVVIAVNALMVWLAITSHPGLVSADAYREGRGHNVTLKSAAVQRARGWRVEDDFRPAGDGVMVVTVTGVDRGGRALRDLAGEVTFRHPFNADWDRALILEARPRGALSGALTLPVGGRWHTRLRLVDAAGRIFRRDREVMVK